MKLTDMRRVLEENGILLTKSLGQNFLHDAQQLERIVDLAEVKSGDHVLEIGPGLGPLTEVLLRRGTKVLAIEKDRRLFALLRSRWPNTPFLTVEPADALAWLRREARDLSQWKVVSNLPYSVASPMLVELAESPTGPISITVTLQTEVANRLQANAGQDDYGILSLLVQPNYRPGNCFKIPASCFFPAPHIESACLTLIRRPAPLVSESLRRQYKRIVKRAFSERRKMMMKLLKFDWPTDLVESVFGTLNLNPQIRAEKVSLAQFVEIATRLAEGLSTPASSNHSAT